MAIRVPVNLHANHAKQFFNPNMPWCADCSKPIDEYEDVTLVFGNRYIVNGKYSGTFFALQYYRPLPNGSLDDTLRVYLWTDTIGEIGFPVDDLFTIEPLVME